MAGGKSITRGNGLRVNGSNVNPPDGLIKRNLVDKVVCTALILENGMRGGWNKVCFGFIGMIERKFKNSILYREMIA